MSKFKKIVLSTLIGLAVLILAAGWLVERTTTSNISKSFVTQKLEEVTGYHVEITGPLEWHYSLRPSLTLEKITFSTGANTVITLEDTNISIELLPLLNRKFSIDFSFQHWQQNQLNFTDGKGHIIFENKIILISKFDAQFYHGKINGNAHIDLNTTPPKFGIKVQASQINIADLLNDIASSKSLSGKMDIKANLNSEGENAAEFIRHLNGEMNLSSKNGKLNTIHLSEHIPRIAAATIAKEDADVFETLNIDAMITNGIANTKIALLAKNYRSEGTGKINLSNQTLNIHLNTYYTRAKDTKDIPIPVDIAGAIASPTITVDITQPLNQFLTTNHSRLSLRLNRLLNRSTT